jgi:hypothetical protein
VQNKYVVSKSTSVLQPGDELVLEFSPLNILLHLRLSSTKLQIEIKPLGCKRANHVAAARGTLGKFTFRPLYLGKGHILPIFKGGVGRSYTGRSLTVTFSRHFCFPKGIRRGVELRDIDLYPESR